MTLPRAPVQLASALKLRPANQSRSEEPNGLPRGNANVLMVSTSYPSSASDWRGLFIYHLAHALARQPGLSMRLWSPPGPIPDGATMVASKAESQWLHRLMAVGGIAHLMRRHRLQGLIAAARLMLQQHRAYRRERSIDVYHVNWLQNALMLPDNRVPLLATVLGTDMALLKLPLMPRMLRRVMRNRQVVICPNASWMIEPLREHFGALAVVQFVPFGIDPGWFAIDREHSITYPHRWLCVSRLTEAKLGTLFKWGTDFFCNGQRELHLFGPMQEAIQLPPWVHYHGAATPDELMHQWFPSATGLISLSQHAEGRPQVMLEAMASGMPIIASAIPAHMDLIEHQQTGWICEGTQGLRSALTLLEDDVGNRQCGNAARAWVKAEVGTWDDCANRYQLHYRQIMSESSK